MFGKSSQAAAPPPPLPEAPPPPPNPPMFGSNSTGVANQRRKTGANQGYAGTILGGITEPANTGQKTLLGS